MSAHCGVPGAEQLRASPVLQQLLPAQAAGGGQ